jgi:uncharacterized protein YjcR
MAATSENKTSLAAKYGVSSKTFTKWLKRIGFEIPKNKGYLYTPEEVRLIIEKLGEP